MQGAAISTGGMRARGAVMLAALAILLRVLIPAGWMPATGDGFAITLCTGSGVMTGWIDKDGSVHKGERDHGGKIDHPCAFAGLGAAFDLPTLVPPALPPLAAATAIVGAAADLMIGRGLAAPPPPPTGPPARL
jgi:hypothetical protein